MTTTPLSQGKFQRAFSACCIAWSALHAALLRWWLGLPMPASLADSLVFNALIAVACLLLAYIMQFYLPRRERHWYIIVLSLALSAGAVFSARVILAKAFAGDSSYLLLLQNSLPLRWIISFLLIACMTMICVSWYSFSEKEETERRSAETESLARRAELLALRNRLQPHFLFNSLNSVSALVGSKPAEARRMIQQLSDFLRGTLLKDERQLITLAEELLQLRLYLEIEQVRFGDRLRTHIQADAAASAMLLPALILQPLLENAVKFGLYENTGEVLITLSAGVEGELLVVTVKNPLDADTVKPRGGEGFGLASVKRRLELLFWRGDLLETSGEGDKFTTTIKIPQPR